MPPRKKPAGRNTGAALIRENDAHSTAVPATGRVARPPAPCAIWTTASSASRGRGPASTSVGASGGPGPGSADLEPVQRLQPDPEREEQQQRRTSRSHGVVGQTAAARPPARHSLMVRSGSLRFSNKRRRIARPVVRPASTANTAWGRDSGLSSKLPLNCLQLCACGRLAAPGSRTARPSRHRPISGPDGRGNELPGALVFEISRQERTEPVGARRSLYRGFSNAPATITRLRASPRQRQHGG